jgi:RNA polymerase sigma-70 factor (ECF subfamily)
MDENAIIDAVLNGNVNRYEHLVARYQVGLIIHCERYTRDRAAAEDLAQEAFIKAFRHLSSYDSQKSRFSTWLYKIATNLALDYVRAQKRAIPAEDIDELSEIEAPDFANIEEQRQVRSAVKALQPDHYRRVIEAYYWQGKSYQDIANDMKVPLNTVRIWLHRAKKQLRSDLS